MHCPRWRLYVQAVRYTWSVIVLYPGHHHHADDDVVDDVVDDLGDRHGGGCRGGDGGSGSGGGAAAAAVIDAPQPAMPSPGLRYAIPWMRRRQMSTTSSVIFRVASETSIVLGTAIPSTAMRSR